jgi:hypothetical protein
MTDLFMELLAMAGREREATITANTMQQGLRCHGLYGFTSPTPDPIGRTTFTGIACDEIDRMKLQEHNADATSPPPTSTEPQSSPPSREREVEGKKEEGGQADSTNAPIRRYHTSRELRMFGQCENPPSKRARRSTRGEGSRQLV